MILCANHLVSLSLAQRSILRRVWWRNYDLPSKYQSIRSGEMQSRKQNIMMKLSRRLQMLMNTFLTSSKIQWRKKLISKLSKRRTMFTQYLYFRAMSFLNVCNLSWVRRKLNWLNYLGKITKMLLNTLLSLSKMYAKF